MILGRRAWLGGFACATACAGRARVRTAAPVPTHAIYDGTGRPSSMTAFAARCEAADDVLFGELHDHPIAAALQLELLDAMLGQPRPLALALEFFETDHQPAIDDYLADRIDEPTFRTATQRGEGYEASHRPLVERCRAAHMPVLAANAPRRLVKAYRLQDAPYDEWRASLPEEERVLLPEWTRPPDDEHKRRFMELMGPERGPSFWRSMALWNDAMAETMADYRAGHPEHRVLLVVGAFHVAGRLGVVTQLAARRPADRALVLTMLDERDSVEFSPEDRGEGDLVVKVRTARP